MRSVKAVPMPCPALVLVRSRIGYVKLPVRCELDPEHVVNADLGDNGAHEIWVLRDHRAHEQTAVASALDRQFFGARVFLFDQIFGRGREIIEHSLLSGKIAGLVPFLTKLATTTDIGHDKNASAIEPEPPRETKRGRLTNTEAAISSEQRRILAVELRAFSANNIERDLRAILGGGEFPRDFDVVERNGRRSDQGGFHRFWFSCNVMKPRRGLRETDVLEKQRAIFERDHFRNGGNFWDWNDLFAFAVQPKPANLRGAADQIADIKRVCCRNQLRGKKLALNDGFARRNNHRGLCQFRSLERQAQNFSVRRAGVG